MNDIKLICFIGSGLLEGWYRPMKGVFMYQIAICDDNTETCDHIIKTLQNHVKSRGIEVVFHAYYSTERLFEYLCAETKYEIIFLDVEFRNMDGIEAGTRIRNELADSLTDIVFMSHNITYVRTIYVAKPHTFIPKPIDETMLTTIFDELIDPYLNQTKPFFEYKIARERVIVDLNDILFFWVDDRIVHIKTKNSEDYFYGTLKDVYARLKRHGFFKANKQYVVNRKHVSMATNETLIMKSGDIISLTKSGRSEFEQALEIIS
jgi:DNA-binding LytR/AlgR family response regulator